MNDLEKDYQILCREFDKLIKRKFMCPHCQSNRIEVTNNGLDFKCQDCKGNICPILKPKKQSFKSFEDYSKDVQAFVNDFNYNIKKYAPNWYLVITKNRNELDEKQKSEWADTFDKLMRIDKHSKARIAAVMRELFQGQFFEFWIEKGNIRTPLKFREKMKNKNWQGITYFDFFLSKLTMASDQPKKEAGYKPAWMQ